jgi:hypothetical protein
MKTEIKDSLDIAGRACSRCHAHKTFRPSEDHKENAVRAVRRTYDLLKNAFEEKRKDDITTIEQIETIKKAKILCLDSIDACKTCDKEQPRIKEMLSNIK